MDENRDFAETFGLLVEESLDRYPLVKAQQSIIPYLFAKQKELLPVAVEGNIVTIAVSHPMDIDSLEELRLLLEKEIKPIYAPAPVIRSAIERCYHQKEEEAKELFSDLQTKGSVEIKQGYDLLEKSEQNPVIRMVNVILLEAIQQGASDVHFEPAETSLIVRYRIDGCLQDRHTPPSEYQAQILTRIKVMAQMDIAEHRLPQDGKIKLYHGGREIDFRVSTLPTSYGERIVLRILDKGNVILGLDQIGMSPSSLSLFRKMIETPEGIILVTGPTGSGKTTTLYSALAEINDSSTNIITVEDPIEYKLEGISQMNVNPRISLNFATGLRHILRQDPDVIMIGEIRDKETAEIAVQASLTGHLVFSTLHTNDAPSALTRLKDMGIEPYLLASSILAVVAQRLVRKICPSCSQSYQPSSFELEEIGLKNVDKLFRAKGCKRCFHSGYKGRLAIYEIMPVSSKIKAQVLKSQDGVELRKVAIKEGMESLFSQGLDLVVQGLTTVEELLRVTKIDRKGG